LARHLGPIKAVVGHFGIARQPSGQYWAM